MGWRLGARFVDIVLFSWLLVFVLVELDQRLFGGDPLGRKPGQLVFDSPRPIVLALALVVLYEVIPVATAGATFGKFAFGLRVREVPPPRAPQWLMSLGRAVMLYVPAFVLGPPGLLVLVALAISFALPASGRGFHDRVVGTAVVSIAEGRGRSAGDGELA